MIALLLALAGAAGAEIYRWTDDQGTTHYTDNLHSVPPAHADRVRTLDDRLPPPPPPPQIPLERRDGGFVVAARLEGRTQVRLVVDTGASVTLLSPRVAQALALEVQSTPPVLLRTANGTVEAGWARLREIEVGGRRAGPLRVVIHEALPGLDGLLGMDFLGQYRMELRAEVPALILAPR